MIINIMFNITFKFVLSLIIGKGISHNRNALRELSFCNSYKRAQRKISLLALFIILLYSRGGNFHLLSLLFPLF